MYTVLVWGGRCELTEASKVKVISPERLELAVSSGAHKPPGPGLLPPAPPSGAVPPASVLA